MENDSAQPWRLLSDGDLTGRQNMARDVALLETVASSRSVPALRLYGWSPPCLSLGKHQDIEAVDLEFCRANGIDVVRRPTGGRAVLHHLELTYSLAARLGHGEIPPAIRQAYVILCGALVQACSSLGVNAEMTTDDANLSLPRPNTSIPCFKAPAGGEVTVAGRKLIGSAMRVHAGTILQHGSILLDWDGRLQAGSMRLESDAALRPFVTTFADQLEDVPVRAEIEAAVASAFSRTLGITFERSAPSRDEMHREHELVEKFAIQTS